MLIIIHSLCLLSCITTQDRDQQAGSRTTAEGRIGGQPHTSQHNKQDTRPGMMETFRGEEEPSSATFFHSLLYIKTIQFQEVRYCG
jgi:hypothetical protein